MSHWPIVPFLLPFVAAIVLITLRPQSETLARGFSLAAVVALLAVSLYLIVLADDGSIRVYRLGNWAPPYGIVLVLDRLSAVMVALSAFLALAALLYATRGVDRRGKHFHALFQLQIAGLNGAFLTGDLFNLFVFFEILLLASYALLVHGGGLARARAGIAYVVLNLLGSALFLIALGLLYGTLGTLNIADMALVLPDVPPENQALVRTALALVVVVFALKAALLPLSFWLPHVYTAASIPIAALFAIMTKVGIYASLRLSTIVLAAAPFTSDLLTPWLPWLALLTIAVGAAGALAATRLSAVVANMVLISSGTLFLAIAASASSATAAALYYLVHTTLVTGGLFLLTGQISRERGDAADKLEKAEPIPSYLSLGAAYLVLAIAVSSLPPLSGFIGKLMVMQSLLPLGYGWAAWGALLVSGLVAALVLARAASNIFWEPGKPGQAAIAPPAAEYAAPGSRLALWLLVAASPLLTLGAAPVSSYLRSAAEQLHARTPYIEAVLGQNPEIKRELRP